MPKLLIIDDEPGILYSLRASLENDDTAVVTAPTARQGLAAAVPRQAGRGHPRRPPAGHVRARRVRSPPGDGPAPAGRHHHRARQHRHGHRGDEARCVRVPAQAGRSAPARGGRSQGLRAAADAGHADRVRRTDRVRDRRAGHRPDHRPLARPCRRCTRRSAASPRRT